MSTDQRAAVASFTAIYLALGFTIVDVDTADRCEVLAGAYHSDLRIIASLGFDCVSYQVDADRDPCVRIPAH